MGKYRKIKEEIGIEKKIEKKYKEEKERERKNEEAIGGERNKK